MPTPFIDPARLATLPANLRALFDTQQSMLEAERRRAEHERAARLHVESELAAFKEAVERLKLLVVPRLAAVLIVVVGLMAILSIVTNSLGGHTGLSIALFPMVIMTMTIERMSILWEERGPTEALVSGFGSILTAAVAFLVMNVKLVEHLAFVFP